VNGKLRIERLLPDVVPAGDAPTASLELVPQLRPRSSIRPYFYRIPKGSPAPSPEAPQEQRRSTDDQPIGPRTQ
jgi:hypothetical protein